MLTTGLLLLQERIDAAVGRRPRIPDDPSPARERALGRHHDDYLESDPVHRQRHFDRTRAPSENLDYYRDLRSRLEAAGVPVVDAPVDLAEFEDWLDRYAILGRFYRRFGEMRIEKCLEHYIVAREPPAPAGRYVRRRGLGRLAVGAGAPASGRRGLPARPDLPPRHPRDQHRRRRHRNRSARGVRPRRLDPVRIRTLLRRDRPAVPRGDGPRPRARRSGRDHAALPRRHPFRAPQPARAAAAGFRGSRRRPDLARRRVQGALLPPLLSRGLRRPNRLADCRPGSRAAWPTRRTSARSWPRTPDQRIYSFFTFVLEKAPA